ncbi:B3 domain-containing transcription factor FUS3 isoform X2 [Spinacia oleracea]|uniref:B3 domain-containing transcription factor FUS3 isoform X2 n=1 Tax=Spinacia oleracea TaxID=3562 RepID=A0ABM3R293_SPIOL|nr:B3 domain-containing transcription factor FUS3-like isoform X2 [Spinacia oleracea]
MMMTMMMEERENSGLKNEVLGFGPNVGVGVGGGGGLFNSTTPMGGKGTTIPNNDNDNPNRTRQMAGLGGYFGEHKIQRKKRMARQRRSSVTLLPFASSASSAAATPSHVPLPARKAAESHLPHLETKEGIYFSMDDMDGLHVWNFKYRFWPNNNSRMYVLENTGDFVTAHRLQVGDFIMVYQDIIDLTYVIQAKKTSQKEIYDEYTTNTVTDYFQVHNFEINRYNQLSWNDPGNMEDNNNNSACMSFVYETTSFLNDSPFDFLGGSVTNYNSRMGGHSFDNFGSVDNLSLEDFY